MAPSHGVTGRNAIANAINAAVNAGSGAGKLKLYNVDDALLATVILQSPAFGPASTGIIILLGIPLTGTAGDDGTVTKFTVTDSDDNVIYQGTAAESGGDLTIDNADLVTSQNVVVVAHRYLASV